MVRIIHCADLHLDSKMDTHLTKVKAEERRHEILLNVKRMFDYAKQNEVGIILISGDLFDTELVSKRTMAFFLDCVKNAPEIRVYYVRGNHDADTDFGFYGSLPENLKLFGDKKLFYEETENVVIYGTEPDCVKDRDGAIESILKITAKDRYNILMLHGQIGETYTKAGGALIPLKILEGRNIDYLALGHIHSFMKGTLGGRGIYVYPGAFDGRGFDETGTHGFCLFEITAGSLLKDPEFVPFESRKIIQIECDISSYNGDFEILSAVKNAVYSAGAGERDYVRVILSGEIPEGEPVNVPFITSELEDLFYVFSLKNETKMKPDFEAYKLSKGLKGELVRLVKDSELTENEKAEVLYKAFLLLDKK